MRYSNLNPEHRPQPLRNIVRWGIIDRLTGRRKKSPPGPGAPRVDPDLELVHRPSGPLRCTWIGHASFLCALNGVQILIDPNFSPHVGRVYKRHVPPGLEPHNLPPIELLLISHAHPDHLDDASIRRLDRRIQVIVPSGLGRWFKRRGFRNVRELGWWESTEHAGLEVSLTPTRHWSRRTPWDTNKSLWGGWIVRGDDASVYHGGDSAWFDGFGEIGQRYPDISLALIAVGAYLPAWFMENNHMNPEQAGQAFLDLGAQRMVPMHWGTFQLTDEPLAEPPERLRAWWQDHAPSDRELHVLAVGETLELS